MKCLLCWHISFCIADIKFLFCWQIFGPVMQLMKFKTTEEVIERSNINKYGLAAAVVTKDLDTALQVANSVRAGTVWWVQLLSNLSPRTTQGKTKISHWRQVAFVHKEIGPLNQSLGWMKCGLLSKVFFNYRCFFITVVFYHITGCMVSCFICTLLYSSFATVKVKNLFA